jgi:hypothetical protein
LVDKHKSSVPNARQTKFLHTFIDGVQGFFGFFLAAGVFPLSLFPELTQIREFVTLYA